MIARTETSPSDVLVSYPKHSLYRGGASYLSAEMKSVYSAAHFRSTYPLYIKKSNLYPYFLSIVSQEFFFFLNTNGFKQLFWPNDETPLCFTPMSQCVSGSNCNEGVYHTLQRFLGALGGVIVSKLD